ncbi:tellurite resistance protein TerA [Jatrophihabitans sp. GAS493]|uniref:TerD family protein n=1 Tax=Jatrophihabitans sp. GAS493 TaxID=1907575 RepID=UPI000BB8DFD1|nr:tellurium resistance protein [Jatrophihabitans sp. GAS493]SOD71736.1 tellurite resistance protein TerA [Jatrophihabitans sp. GAS493]
MGIDYTKRPKAAEPVAPVAEAAPAPAASPAPAKVTLTKAAPTVSLTKRGSAGGMLRVNLNWNARPAAAAGAGFFKRLAPQAGIDLDLGCLFEFTDGSKGVVQALGNAFSASPKGVMAPVIRLDGDDRSGTNNAGENLFVDLSYVNQIKRIMVFAFIYQGVANWAAADGLVTLYPAAGPQVEVRLDEARDGARICGIALLESHNGELTVRREVNYVDGGQSALDRAYGWGMNWAPGRK